MLATRARGRISLWLRPALCLLLALPFSAAALAAAPAAGTITPTGAPVTWDGEGLIPTDTDEFALTVGGTTGDWTGKQIRISITWVSPSTDYDLKVHKGTSADPVARESGQGATTFESVIIAPSESGVGLYTVVAEYFAATAADQYHGEARVETAPPVVPPPAGGGNPRYQNYVAPPDLGNSAGEPTLGVNTVTGNVMYIAGLQTLRASFDDCSSPAAATWTDVTAPNTSLASLDPILWTSPVFNSLTGQTCRTFVSQLAVKSSSMAYTDNDGDLWTPSQGSGVNSGVDHQMIGGGPFAAPLTRDPSGTLFPWAVYYCAQDIADANCALSLDGGQTFGPAIPIYTAADCGGLHGHLKVAPNDGTVYVPNKRCPGVGDRQAVVVSVDNGSTWAVKPVTDSTFGRWDPSIEIGAGGRVFFGYSNALGHAMASVSNDRGDTWSPSVDVGAAFGVQDIAFPAVIAGDNDRAAFAFLGTTSAAGDQANAIWHLFIATTFNGGTSWTTVDATPNDPVQRGTICSSGLGCGNDRNMLDFMDATVDAVGRVLVGYADGCIDSCVLAPPNSFSAKATIARQSGGKRLFAAFDPVEPAAPAAPNVHATRDAGAVHLSWAEPDNGGSAITGYNVYRSTSQNSGFALLGNTTTPKFDDQTAVAGTAYFYRVRGVNGIGEGAFCVLAVAAGSSVVESPCAGAGLTILQDSAGDSLTTSKHDVRSLSIAEPYFSDGSDKVVFTLKIEDLSAPLPPSTTYPVDFYNSGDPAATGRFVAMVVDATGAAAFKYGTSVRNGDGTYGARTTIGDLDAGSAFQANGTITLIASASKIGSPGVGAVLSEFLTRVQTTVITPDNMPDTFHGAGAYTRVGNASCRPNNAPTALLAATPLSGVAPLDVAFDAGGSTDPDGDAITEYRYNFGDGTPVLVTNDPTVQHTYADPGEYRAILTVRDARNLVSANESFQEIEVEDTPGTPPSLRINNVKKLEGDSGYTDFVFTVTRTGDVDDSSAVRYHTEAGTGTVPEDFVNISNATLSFGPGATSRTITVRVVGDGKRDADDKFFVVLTNPTEATISDGRGKGTIINDDPFLKISNLTVDEPANGTIVARFRVTLSYATPRRVTVHFRTRNGTAHSGSDYTAVSNGTLTFAAGQTVKYAQVVIKFNAPNEPDERFFVDLFNVTNAFIRDGSAKGIIRD
jgi:hypothetical protein